MTRSEHMKLLHEEIDALEHRVDLTRQELESLQSSLRAKRVALQDLQREDSVWLPTIHRSSR